MDIHFLVLPLDVAVFLFSFEVPEQALFLSVPDVFSHTPLPSFEGGRHSPKTIIDILHVPPEVSQSNAHRLNLVLLLQEFKHLLNTLSRLLVVLPVGQKLQAMAHVVADPTVQVLAKHGLPLFEYNSA